MLKSVDQPRSEAQPPVEYHLPSEQRGGSHLLLLGKALLQTVLALAVVFGAVQGMNYFIATKPDVAKRPVQEKSYAVVTAPVLRADHTPSISVFGEATAGRTVDLRALVAGEVVLVHPELKAGGLVSEGEELVVVDKFDYEGALTEAQANLAEERAALVESLGRVELEKANVVRAREQLEFAQRDLERAEDLLQRGSVTERTADERKLLVSQRQQGLEQRQNALALEQAKVVQQEAAIERYIWRLENAERQLANTVLKAPFDAVVRSEAAQPGRLINVNDVIASIYARDELEVRFTLSDNQYGRLVAESGTVVDRPVTVLWTLGNKVLEYDGIVDRTGADVASNRGGVDVFAKITMAAGQTPLRPGAFVEVVIPDQTYPGSFRLPETAIYGEGTVYVIKGNRLVARKVAPRAFDDGFLIVEGDLKDGETVLATRIPEAGEGLLVRPIDGTEEAVAGAQPAPTGGSVTPGAAPR